MNEMVSEKCDFFWKYEQKCIEKRAVKIKNILSKK